MVVASARGWVAIILILLIIAFVAYQLRVSPMALSPPIGSGDPGKKIPGGDCNSVKTDFTDEWRALCKSRCVTQSCREDLDKQTKIRWCKPNNACLTGHGKSSLDEVQYTCNVYQEFDSLKYVAFLECDDEICYGELGGGTIFRSCGCQKVFEQ